MSYNELLVRPMREDLTRLGVLELRTPEEVRDVMDSPRGTQLLVVNSVCGCAAANARPAVAMALDGGPRPERLTTVFAGQDREATEAARGYLHGYAPSSPSIALLRDGEVVTMLERHRIEGRTAEDISKDLTEAFEEYCGTPAA